MLALITAALTGLASLPKLIQMLMDMNVAARLDSLEKKSEVQSAAFVQLANAVTPEERQNAILALSKSVNS